MLHRLFLLAVLSALGLSAEGFRAAAVKVDITPTDAQWLLGYQARQSTGVHDPIHHRILALDDGATPFLLLSSEFCLFSPAFYDETAVQLQRETGIPPEQIWWTVTHTHSAPEVGPPGLLAAMMPERYKHSFDRAYAARVQRTLIDGVKEARARMVPVSLAAATSMAAANINRRARDPDGRISLGLNPDGPVDRQLGLIRLSRPDGSLVALVANYAIHGTVLGGKNLLISGDAPGIVASYVEEKLGAPMLFLNGAAGNLAPIYTVLPDFAASHITEFNVLLGDRILAATRAMGAGSSEFRIRAGQQAVETPLRQGFAWDDSLRSYLRTASSGEKVVRIPVRYVTFGSEIAVWAAPLELFCEVAVNVRSHSPFPHTFYAGYTNGWLGYLPTRQAFAEGGYEVKTSPFTERAEDDLTRAAITRLQGMAR